MSTVAARFALRAYGLDVDCDWALTGATPMTAPPPAASIEAHLRQRGAR